MQYNEEVALRLPTASPTMSQSSSKGSPRSQRRSSGTGPTPASPASSHSSQGGGSSPRGPPTLPTNGAPDPSRYAPPPDTASGHGQRGGGDMSTAWDMSMRSEQEDMHPTRQQSNPSDRAPTNYSQGAAHFSRDGSIGRCLITH